MLIDFNTSMLNVGGIQFGDTWLISPTTKFSAIPTFPAIWSIICIHGTAQPQDNKGSLVTCRSLAVNYTITYFHWHNDHKLFYST